MVTQDLTRVYIRVVLVSTFCFYVTSPHTIRPVEDCAIALRQFDIR